MAKTATERSRVLRERCKTTCCNASRFIAPALPAKIAVKVREA